MVRFREQGATKKPGDDMVAEMSNWANARLTAGAVPGADAAASRLARTALEVNSRFGPGFVASAVCWDAPGWLREQLDTFEREVGAACAEMRAATDRAQTARAAFEADVKRTFRS